MKTGNSKAFIEELVVKNKVIILRTVQNVLGKEYAYLAEDAVGDVYLLACEKAYVLKSHPCPGAWLTVAARYVALSLIRNQNAQVPTVPLNEYSAKSDKDNVYNEVLYRIWLENKLPEKILASLSNDEMAVYLKLYVENKKAKTAIEELQLPKSTFYSIRNRMEEKIKEKIF